MIRLLDFALLTFLVWFVWGQVIRGWRAANAAQRAGGAEPADAPPMRRTTATGAGDPAAMTLVRCSACGVHVPSRRTLPGSAGEVFCSEACSAHGADGGGGWRPS